MFTATAAEIVDTDQPNSARSGSISTPGTARNAAAPISARKVTAATHQAGWTRWVRTGCRAVTPQMLREDGDRTKWPDSQHVQGSGHVGARGRRPGPAALDGLRAGHGEHGAL